MTENLKVGRTITKCLARMVYLVFLCAFSVNSVALKYSGKISGQTHANLL